MSNIDKLLRIEQGRLDAIMCRLPHFAAVMPIVDELYERSIALVPRASGESDKLYGQSLLFCHKDFLSAALSIGRGHPDDAAATTRRTIETVSISRAVKHDSANLERWSSYEQRLRRWAARTEGQRPSPFQAEIKYPPRHEVLEELRRYLGVLSDAFVHFTPEFLEFRGWKTEGVGDNEAMVLPYLTDDLRVIERELTVLGGVHYRALHLFDECFDGSFGRDAAWRNLETRLVEAAEQINVEYFAAPPEEEAAPG